MRRATGDKYVLGKPSEFQSTLSMRRATGPYASDSRNMVISIHALHEESDIRPNGAEGVLFISIHALHEESDLAVGGARLAAVQFQSTLSMRRATVIISVWPPSG